VTGKAGVSHKTGEPANAFHRQFPGYNDHQSAARISADDSADSKGHVDGYYELSCRWFATNPPNPPNPPLIQLIDERADTRAQQFVDFIGRHRFDSIPHFMSNVFDDIKGTGKKYGIFLASGRILAVWRHAQGSVVGDLAGFDGEAGDLPLHLAGGRPALGVRRAGMRGVPDVFADV
jgi:hypothetical protein